MADAQASPTAETSRGVFISYSNEDRPAALELKKALEDIGLAVWMDDFRLVAGDTFPNGLEEGIRSSVGVVILLTPASTKSQWVTYEFAFARGADVPVMVVRAGEVALPAPLDSYHAITDALPEQIAAKVRGALDKHSAEARKQLASQPRLVAKFQEQNGKVVRIGRSKVPSLCIDLWIENAPADTQQVAFELSDLEFARRKWTLGRKKNAIREFLTDDMNSYGDVEVWARGFLAGGESWLLKTSLYEALTIFYRDVNASPDVSSALLQIRNN